MKKGPAPVPLAGRFWRKVKKTSGCWEWTAQRDGKGYGRLRGPEENGRRGRNAIAHRISWVLHFGPIPKGLGVLHHCDNPPCVRPDHLFLGTTADNNKDAKAKGRTATGSRNGAARLTEGDVIDIRHRLAGGEVQKDIARRFDVSKQLISAIAHGHVWNNPSVPRSPGA